MTVVSEAPASEYTELQKMALVAMLKKLVKLQEKHDWPPPVSEAASRYADVLIVPQGDPDAIHAAWTELLREACHAFGQKNGVSAAKAVRRRFATICYELRDHLAGTILPGFSQKWFVGLYTDVVARYPGVEKEEVARLTEATESLDKRIRRSLT